MAATVSNRSVYACAEGLWHLHLWHPKNPRKTQTRVPFRCRSWRHEGPCRQWKGAQDFVRVAQAVSSHNWWSYIVLTFAQRDWPSEWHQAKEGVKCWSRLRKRFTRAFGSVLYIQTWERHQKRGFHVNLALSSSAVARAVGRLSSPTSWEWLRRHAEESGFGYICWAERLRRDSTALAGYLTKLSRELTGAGVKNQVPVQAPPHFRRLRASRGLLPPVHKSDFTGRLVQAPLESFVTVAGSDQSGLHATSRLAIGRGDLRQPRASLAVTTTRG